MVASVLLRAAIPQIPTAAVERADRKRLGFPLLPGQVVALDQIERDVDEMQRARALVVQLIQKKCGEPGDGVTTCRRLRLLPGGDLGAAGRSDAQLFGGRDQRFVRERTGKFLRQVCDHGLQLGRCRLRERMERIQLRAGVR